ncbi:MAG: tRNA threonylcarbamoyladenosine dehydratase [Lachnospiraceae bacterium]|nr:tRNA threonylcarbamoyladenosine dehydratase [Lachnospiraceae bacterium]
MLNQFSRTQLIYGAESMEKLASSRVAVFGIGGVGGYVVEALARSGIGALDLVDNDRVCLTNINRQILATRKTIGRYKVDVAEERVHEIHPGCTVRTYKTFYLPETQDQFDFRDYDYVVDAIDTVTGKLTIIENAKKAGVPVISSMGAGNKVNPAAFEVADLYATSICPLAKVMRRECRKRGIDALKVVYSKEVAIRPLEDLSGGECVYPSEAGRGSKRRAIPGSTAFVPSVAGLIIAGEVVNDLTRETFARRDAETAREPEG